MAPVLTFYALRVVSSMRWPRRYRPGSLCADALRLYEGSPIERAAFYRKESEASGWAQAAMARVDGLIVEVVKFEERPLVEPCDLEHVGPWCADPKCWQRHVYGDAENSGHCDICGTRKGNACGRPT